MICAVLYERFYTPSPDGGVKISAASLYTCVSVLAAVWVVSFVIFLRLINPKYISTFFTTKTGIQFTIDSFKNGNDLEKSFTFSVQRRHWSSIRGEVKKWTTSNWTKWETEKPVWFTEQFISTVPDEFIPTKLTPDRGRATLLGSLLNESSPTGKDGSNSRRSKASRRRAATARVAQSPNEIP
jgi:hypothetical protein